ELGQHTGLSAALLSKIERGRLFPTLPTLLRIALVFSVDLAYFFADDRRRHTFAVVRRTERNRFPGRYDGRDAPFSFECLDFAATERRLNAYFAEFKSSARGTPATHCHDGAEFIYVIAGRLALYFAGETTMLDRGDSVYFDGSVPHGYGRAGKSRCTAIIVTAP
ncbi:MAG: helix-turn-helix domain-containing protein, partial [Candidatus Binataceae bacterium]